MSARLLDRVMTRVVNPIVRAVLASPVHGLLGSRLAVLGVTGRRSGRVLRVPVGVLSEGSGLIVLSRADRRWWRNLRAGGPVTVLRHGTERPGWAQVDEAPARGTVVALLMRAYAEAGHPISRARAAELAADRVVVRVALDSGRPAPAPVPA